jgi:hypothetical protein
MDGLDMFAKVDGLGTRIITLITFMSGAASITGLIVSPVSLLAEELGQAFGSAP